MDWKWQGRAEVDGLQGARGDMVTLPSCALGGWQALNSFLGRSWAVKAEFGASQDRVAEIRNMHPEIATKKYMALCLLSETIRVWMRIKTSVSNQSVPETTFGNIPGLIGSFMTYPKKDKPREMLLEQASNTDLRLRGSDGSTSTLSLRKNAYVSSHMSDLS